MGTHRHTPEAPPAARARLEREQTPATLRRDVRLLGSVLGQVLVEAEGPELLADVERLRLAAIELRTTTAHPTEARRRAVVDALRRISQQVERLDDPRLSASEQAGVRRRLLEETSILWRTAQLRRQRPTPLDEVRTVMSAFDETLF